MEENNTKCKCLMLLSMNSFTDICGCFINVSPKQEVSHLLSFGSFLLLLLGVRCELKAIIKSVVNICASELLAAFLPLDMSHCILWLTYVLQADALKATCFACKKSPPVLHNKTLCCIGVAYKMMENQQSHFNYSCVSTSQ